MSYEYSVGIVRAKEDALIKRIDWERLVAIVSLRDVWNELERLEVGYREVKEFERVENIPKIFTENIVKLYEDTASYLKEEELKISFLLYFDVHNIKLLFKKKVLGVDIDKYVLNSGWYGIKDFDDYPKSFDKVISNLKTDSPTVNPRQFDIMLDNILYSYRVNTAETLGNSFIRDFWKQQIDFINIRICIENIQTKELEGLLIENGFIPVDYWIEWLKNDLQNLSDIMNFWGCKDIYEQALESIKESAVSWEKTEENYMLKYINDAVMYCSSPEPIVSYFYRRYCELKNINRILYGKAFNLKNEDIHNQLNECYIA